MLIFQWAFMMFLTCIVLLLWAKSQSYGWAKLHHWMFLIVMVFAGAFGETYFLEHDGLPWFFGLDMNQGQNHAAVFILCTIAFFLVPRIIRPVFEKLSTWYTNSKMPGRISAFGVAWVFMLVYGWLSFNTAAAFTKASEMQPAHVSIATASDLAAGTMEFFAKVLKEDEELNRAKGK